jgi:hypothetical protein
MVAGKVGSDLLSDLGSETCFNASKHMKYCPDHISQLQHIYYP